MIPRYEEYRSHFRIVLGSKVTLKDFETKWFLRWNNDDTVFDWESFKCQSLLAQCLHISRYVFFDFDNIGCGVGDDYVVCIHEAFARCFRSISSVNVT